MSGNVPSDASGRTTWVATVLTAAIAFLFAWTPLGDRDWPWHLATYDRILAERHLVWDDRWSYASEGLLPPVHWIFQILLGTTHAALGLTGIVLLRASLVAVIFGVLHRILVRRGLGPVAASGLALTVAALSRSRLIERPHLVTILGIALLWHLLLELRDRERKRLIALPVLFLVWANSHPGVVHGAILASGFALAELARVPLSRALPALRALPARGAALLAGWVGAGLLATLVTPCGPTLYPYLLEHRVLQKELNILELRALDLSQPQDWAFVAALVVATAILLRKWRLVDLTELGGAAGFVVLAFTVRREVVLALETIAIVLAPVLAATIAEARSELRDKERGLHVFAWGFALLLGFGVPLLAIVERVVSGRVGGGLAPDAYPVREADWILKARPEGPLYNTNGAGGYLIWRLDPIRNPQWKVFTDGRQPLFRKALVMPFVRQSSEGSPGVEETFHPNLLVLDYQHLPWIGDANEVIGNRYALAHFSDGGRTYVRREGPNSELASAAYKHVHFYALQDPEAWSGWRLSISIDGHEPEAAHKELLARALAEEPGGYWANLADSLALLRLNRLDEAAQAAEKALAVRPESQDARGVLGATGKRP